MLRHLKKLAIINDAATDETAVLSNVTDGVDGASSFGLGDGDELQTLSIEDNQAIHSRITRALDIRTLVGTSSEETNIEGYTSNQTKVFIAGLGIDGFVLIGDKETDVGDILIVKNEQREDNQVWELTASKDVQPGHDPDTGLFESGFWVGENGLGAYLWGDADSSGVADGWTASLFTTSFASGQQTLTADDGASENTFKRAIWFPFEGVELTYSINIDTLADDTNYDTDIEITFYDASDVVIFSQSTAVSATGRKSVTATVPDGTVWIECDVGVILTGTGSTANTVVSDPMLAIGTSTTYTRD